MDATNLSIVPYGREVVVRSRVWFGPFHSRMYEVCDGSGGEPYTPIALFDCVDDVWKYIVAEGHRVRNWESWLLTTIDVYRQCRSKWVGESEQNIAKAFRRAEAEHAVLLFDEVDGLLQDRSGASRSWEITQVNELLQQMENFDGVMVAATNFSKNLDAAVIRHFTFKLEFGYLDDTGKKLFFERVFRTKLADAEFAELKELLNLVPGDFRTVRQGQFYLGDEVTNADRITALKEECALKKDGRSLRPIGFAA